MTFGGTQSILSTRIVHQACNFAHILITQLVIRTLTIVFTFHPKAADFIIFRVSSKSRFASAYCFVILACALSIPTANRTTAGVNTFCLTYAVAYTFLRRCTIFIIQAFQFLDANAILAKLEVWTRRVWFAGWLAYALDAQLISNTLSRCCTNSWKINSY